MADEILQIKNLRIEFVSEGEVTKAVNGVDLSIAQGKTLGLWAKPAPVRPPPPCPY